MVVGEDDETDTLHLPSLRGIATDGNDDAEGAVGLKG